MAAAFYLRTLGLPALETAGGAGVRFRTRKHLALLVYLAVEQGPAHRRDRLVELLWSSAPAADGRHSLSMALSVLRARLGADALIATRQAVRLAPRVVELDLARLLARDVTASPVRPALPVAAFLADFDVPDAPDFAHWKEAQQARLLPAIRDALVLQMDRCRRTGDFGGIEALADRMLGLDEISEEAVRAKMEARAFAGDRLTALRIFEQYERTLRDHYGAVPDGLIAMMAMRLRRRGWERSATANEGAEVPAVQTDYWKNRPFVGRAAEYQTLYEMWEVLRDGGGPGHVLLLGDSGVGKSTLVERFTTAATLQGASVVRVQCYEPERDIPYAAIATLTRLLMDRPGSSGTPPESLAELARLVPDIRRRYAAVPPPVDSHGENARLLMAEAFLELIAAVAEEHPLILAVDDLHFADDASLALLHFVLRRSAGRPLLIVLTARRGELTKTPRADHIRATADALRIRPLPIEPMGDAESAELLASLLPPDTPAPGAAERRALIRAAGGFPMALELLLRDWLVHGRESLALSVPAITEAVSKDGSPEAAYRRVIDRLVRALDPDVRNVLNLAALLGGRLHEMSLYTVGALDPRNVLAGLVQLTDLRLLRSSPTGLEFTNELVRAHVYLMVPVELRKSLHHEIASRLISRIERGDAIPGLELAWHCIRSGREDVAAIHLLRGATEAMANGAPHETERALGPALDWLEGEALARAMMLFAEALLEQARRHDLLQFLSEERVRRTLASDERFVMEAAATHPHAMAPKDAHYSVQQLCRVVRETSDASLRARAALTAALTASNMRDRELIDNVRLELDSVDSNMASTTDTRRLRIARAALLLQTGQVESSLAMLTSRDADDATCCDSTVVRLYLGLGNVKCARGEYSLAIDDFVRAFELARRIENPLQELSAAANAALCAGRIGEYREQLRWALIGHSVSAAAQDAVQGAIYAQMLCVYSEAMALAMAADCERASQALQQITFERLPAAAPWISQAWYLYCADIMALCRKRDSALQYGRLASFEMDGRLYSDRFAGPYLRWASRAARTDSERASVCQAAEDLLNRIDELDAKDQLEVGLVAGQLSMEGQYNVARIADVVNRSATLLPRPFQDQLSMLMT